MRNFNIRVVMMVTQNQFDADLRESLNCIGYDTDGLNLDSYPYILNQGSSIYSTILQNKEYGFFIDKYNPELFLALASMSEGDEFYPGEYVFLKDKEIAIVGEVYGETIKYVKGHGTGSLISYSGYSKSDLKKLTKEEIILHFTKKEEEPISNFVISGETTIRNEWALAVQVKFAQRHPELMKTVTDMLTEQQRKDDVSNSSYGTGRDENDVITDVGWIPEPEEEIEILWAVHSANQWISSTFVCKWRGKYVCCTPIGFRDISPENVRPKKKIIKYTIDEAKSCIAVLLKVDVDQIEIVMP